MATAKKSFDVLTIKTHSSSGVKIVYVRIDQVERVTVTINTAGTAQTCSFITSTGEKYTSRMTEIQGHEPLFKAFGIEYDI